MQMTEYLWNLYLKSGGQSIVEHFKAFELGKRNRFSSFILSLIRSYSPDEILLHFIKDDIDDAISVLSSPCDENSEDLSPIEDYEKSTLSAYLDEAHEMWEALQQNSIKPYFSEKQLDKETFFYFCDNLVYYSILFYADNPQRFIPYFFPRMYHVLTFIANAFEIRLPDTPKQQDYRGRFNFYYKLCSTFLKFRDENAWTSAELCAFLYDFAPKFVGEKSWLWETLPEPHAAFVIGAPPTANKELQFVDNKSIFSWQGNPDTQPGDIILLYQWAPISAFTSIWQAMAPGFIDPLFRYYRCIYIGNPVSIPHLSFQELKNDPILGCHALVKTHMLGMNGTELKPNDYHALENRLFQKGADFSVLPKLTAHLDCIGKTSDIKNERDVEVLLLEPLLERLGWSREDYVRQMPLRMGRGSTVYPDYVILPQFTFGHEKGFWIAEAKKSIPTAKQLNIDCGQAASYAQRLESSGLMLVAREGIWIGERKDDFRTLQHYSWAQLQNSNIFLQVYAIVGNKKKVHSRSSKKSK